MAQSRHPRQTQVSHLDLTQFQVHYNYYVAQLRSGFKKNTPQSLSLSLKVATLLKSRIKKRNK